MARSLDSFYRQNCNNLPGHPTVRGLFWQYSSIVCPNWHDRHSAEYARQHVGAINMVNFIIRIRHISSKNTLFQFKINKFNLWHYIPWTSKSTYWLITCTPSEAVQTYLPESDSVIPVIWLRKNDHCKTINLVDLSVLTGKYFKIRIKTTNSPQERWNVLDRHLELGFLDLLYHNHKTLRLLLPR